MSPLSWQWNRSPMSVSAFNETGGIKVFGRVALISGRDGTVGAQAPRSVTLKLRGSLSGVIGDEWHGLAAAPEFPSTPTLVPERKADSPMVKMIQMLFIIPVEERWRSQLFRSLTLSHSLSPLLSLILQDLRRSQRYALWARMMKRTYVIRHAVPSPFSFLLPLPLYFLFFFLSSRTVLLPSARRSHIRAVYSAGSRRRAVCDWRGLGPYGGTEKSDEQEGNDGMWTGRKASPSNPGSSVEDQYLLVIYVLK